MVFGADQPLQEVLAAAHQHRTTLEAWFALNRENPGARQWLYQDIPRHFVWIKPNTAKREPGHWKPRERQVRFGRMVSAQPSE